MKKTLHPQKIRANARREKRMAQAGALLKDLPVAFLLVDTGGRVVMQNDACRAFLGTNEGQRLEQSTGSPDAGIRLGQLIAPAYGGQVTRAELAIPAGAGAQVLDCLAFPWSETPIFAGVCVLIEDISARKQNEAEMERGARHLAALSQMGQAVFANLRLSEVLNRVLDAVFPLLAEARVVSILLAEGQALTVAASRSRNHLAITGKRIPADQGVIAQVMMSGRAVRIPSLGTGYLGQQAVEEGEQPYALLASPLKLQNDVVGVMTAAYPVDSGAHEEDLQLLDTAAAWVAVAIANIRQHEETARRLRETEAIASISRALNEARDLEKIFQLIVNSAHQLTARSEGAVIHRLDDGNSLTPVAVSGSTLGGAGGLDMRIGEGIAGQVLASSQLINVVDVASDRRCLPVADSAMRSLLVAPIRSETQRFGTISVQSTNPHAFDEHDERILEMLGVEAALALKNVQLYHDERANRQLAEALAEADKALNQSLDLNFVLDCILAQLPRIIPCKNVNLMLIEGDHAAVLRQEEYQVMLDGSIEATPAGKETLLATRVPLSLPTIQVMMTTGQPLHYPDTAQEPEWLPIPGTRWIRSYLAVPLAVGNQVLGFLNLNSDQPNFFASSMIPALQSFAAHASIAIQNARQYQALQKALEHEQAMRDQLIHADRLASMGRMAGSIAHEINNPLQAIQGCIERSLVFPGDVARQQRYLGMAQQEITRLAEIVQRVMNYQRPVVGMMQTEDPRSILEDVLALSGKRLQHAKVDVSISWEDNLPKVHVITNQIKQVFLNLLLNAVDAMPKGGSLTISARRVEQDGDWLAIAFKDTGQGMSKESREHIFEPFFSTKASGTGLGLWVSKNILDSHDGRITAESASGEGTTMTVWLPLKK